MDLEYEVAGFSVKGRRERNEDAFLIDRERMLFAVADGLSVPDNGDKASRFALDTITSFLPQHAVAAMAPHDLAAAVEDAILETNVRLRQTFSPDTRGRFPCTTLTLAFLLPGYIVYGHVGDSRAYTTHAGMLPPKIPWWRTSVQTSQMLVQVTKDDKTFNPFPYAYGGMDQALGCERIVPATGVVEVAPSQCGMVVCSDGVYQHMTKLVAGHQPNWYYNPSEELEAAGREGFARFFGNVVLRKGTPGLYTLGHQILLNELITSFQAECSHAADNATAIYLRFKNKFVPY